MNRSNSSGKDEGPHIKEGEASADPIPHTDTEGIGHHNPESRISEFDDASAWTKWTFSVASPLITKGFTNPVQFDDLLHLSTHDQPDTLINHLKQNYKACKPFFILPRLFVAMLTSHKRELYYILFYTLLEGATKIALPLTLKSLLRALEHEVLHLYIK